MLSKVNLATLFSIFLMLSGCVTQPLKEQKNNAEVYSYQAFFGLSKPDGGVVSLAEWSAFEAKVISPEFLKGFTVFDAKGYYEGVPEQSKVLTVIVKASDVDASLKKLRQIAQTYVTTFGQDSVMLTKSPVVEWRFIN